MEIGGETIAEFDASVLRVDGRSNTSFSVRVAASVDEVIAAQSSWDAASTSEFHWPAVYNRSENARFFMMCNQDAEPTQAMLQLRLPWTVPCDRARRDPLPYISFVEVAPWNRTLHPTRRFQGLGTRMIAIASWLSELNGFNGKVGLHAVPASAQFYQSHGFGAVDCFNEYKELYLELDQTAATTVRTRGGLRK